MSIDSTIDFNAVLLDQEDIKRLNVLLVPTDPLMRDVRSVAGQLGFCSDEVRYVIDKPYPFVYMYTQWIKRDGRDATLQKLLSILKELRRIDAVEIVEKAIQAIHQKDPKEVLKTEETYFSTLQRSISCTTLCASGNNVTALDYQHSRNSKSGVPVPQILQKTPLMLKNQNDIVPDVFVVYYPENEKHIRNVLSFVKRLRKGGIDATCDMFESQSGNDRGFYIYSKLLESQYVCVVCTETFNESSKVKPTDDMDEQSKEVAFIMNMILTEIYATGGINKKFIPVLFAHATDEMIPHILKGSTMYKMPNDLEDLKRRIFGLEKYKLAPLPAKRPVIKPKVIGGGNGLLPFTRRWKKQ